MKVLPGGRVPALEDGVVALELGLELESLAELDGPVALESMVLEVVPELAGLVELEDPVALETKVLELGFELLVASVSEEACSPELTGALLDRLPLEGFSPLESSVELEVGSLSSLPVPDSPPQANKRAERAKRGKIFLFKMEKINN